jgi:hypothetical protein
MDREREEKGARGIHASGARPKDQMPPPERIEEVRDAVKRFAIVNAGHAIQSVEGMGAPKWLPPPAMALRRQREDSSPGIVKKV